MPAEASQIGPQNPHQQLQAVSGVNTMTSGWIVHRWPTVGRNPIKIWALELRRSSAGCVVAKWDLQCEPVLDAHQAVQHGSASASPDGVRFALSAVKDLAGHCAGRRTHTGRAGD